MCSRILNNFHVCLSVAILAQVAIFHEPQALALEPQALALEIWAPAPAPVVIMVASIGAFHHLASRLACAARLARKDGIPAPLLAHAEQALREVADAIRQTREQAAEAPRPEERFAAAPEHVRAMAGLLATLASPAPSARPPAAPPDDDKDELMKQRGRKRKNDQEKYKEVEKDSEEEVKERDGGLA